ncbi:ABC transporter permease subunit [Alphaproteobacteria bacterium GH1-50]|uniref:sn-glycerol-3-phosphate transport system permease protein UgpA n=1 Tax=Kangsaoukella pontilimi TaxID=2691042 RepID=A0A7C9MHW6_9RHOB|nr:ABC transporter permease subunit [Kangsaoukella pontilimi]MXQ06455.1 ABC transporter permease subunit [Kangsaoukella pontilimi]
MEKAQFQSRWMPYLLLAPQMVIIAIFFIWPAAEAIRASFFLEDPFFGNSTFVGLQNYTDALSASDYKRTAWFTVVFTVLVSLLSLALGMMLAVSADRVLRGQSTYKTLLMWVYAIAPPVAGLIGVMLFDQHIGPLVDFAAMFGWHLQIGVDYWDTGFAMIVVSTWKQVPYCFIFFLSGLQSIPTSVKEASAIDCQSETRRFWTITFPLLAPTTFFLLILNITYAMFETFGTIDQIVKDQPGNSPVTLVYKVFRDGFRGNDIGGSSAQSVILMIFVLLLTIVQFRLIERRIHYT